MNEIKNLPDYAKDYEYIVIRNCGDDGIWFFGAFHDFKKSVQAASECGNGVVIARTNM